MASGLTLLFDLILNLHGCKMVRTRIYTEPRKVSPMWADDYPLLLNEYVILCQTSLRIVISVLIVMNS
jgi:hypothetical protein